MTLARSPFRSVVAVALVLLSPCGMPGAEEGSLTYTGRVVDLEGRPVEGAWVQVRHALPPAQTMTLCSGTGKWWDWARELLPREEDDRKKEDQEKALKGEPLYREGLTDAAGRFEVKGVPLPSGAVVVAGRRDFITSTAKADPSRLRGAVQDVGEIRLDPGASLRARVLDRDGNPLPEAWVAVQLTAPKEPRKDRWGEGVWGAELTDRDGRCTLKGLPPGRYRAAAGSRRGLPAEKWFDVEPGSDVTFQLEPSLPLEVEVLEQGSGLPRPGTRVKLKRIVKHMRVGGERNCTFDSGLAGPDGRVRFEGLDDEEFLVTAIPADQKEDASNDPEAFSVSGVGRPGMALRILLAPVLQVPLVVRDQATGKPVPGARVQASVEWSMYDKSGGWPEEIGASSDEAREVITLEGVRPGPWRIRVFAADHLPRESGVLEIPARGPVPPVLFELEPARGRLTGTILDQTTGAAIARAKVWSYEQVEGLGAQEITVETDAAGRFVLQPLLGEGWPLLLRIEAEGYVGWERRLKNDEARSPDLGEVLLERKPPPPQGSIRGRVVDSRGRPQPHVRVVLVRGEARLKDRTRYAVADEAGTFLFEALPAGTYNLEGPDGAQARLVLAAEWAVEVVLKKPREGR